MRKYKITHLKEEDGKFVEVIEEKSAVKAGITPGGDLFFADGNNNLVGGYAPGRWAKFDAESSNIKLVE